MIVVYDGKKYEIEEKTSVKKLLKRFKADELFYIVIDKKNNKLLTADEQPEKDSIIEIKKVMSTG